MLRLSQLMRELAAPEGAAPVAPSRARPIARPGPPRPVVIWNLIRRCNLNCRHCYSISADVDFPGELTTAQVFAVMDDLRAFGVPALILSGGEPLLRPDIFEISARAKALGFYVGLSTNGTAIDAPMADRIAGIGYDYVGISLDGLEPTHDRFRRQPGAFAASLAGVRHCRERGLKVGLRFTITRDNAAELPALLDLAEAEQVHKFYLSHLNYAGRGNRNRGDDAEHAMTRAAMDLMFERCWEQAQRGIEREVTTGNNDADGVYLLHWARRRVPERAARLEALLRRWGGNSAGVNIANIDNLGHVHPDTMWWHVSLGTVKERPFSAIWADLSNPLLAGLRARPRAVTGRCGACAYLAICNGSSRVRPDRTLGDVWAEDPGCYLTDAEIGLAPAEGVDALALA
ncbi:heme d1 biosynthesis radical SAM protein NirJ [Roseicella aquatilis]|uniref:Pre-heme d1 synthase n=1 Tax=Roseicella aquatilis TaxID=2527868 RepID=A0A4R4D8I1_9PROT|nr:heme d1 biosynthesis radical SAM protein NirJ [Roseicella aquatilis]TCZ55999.1 heme d1 biosynthesis radical SAM protein NirJ [Roseicella aquatilis]